MKTKDIGGFRGGLIAKHPKLADELESALKEGATISIAAALCGLHTQTVRQWIRRGAAGDPYYTDFYRRMRKVQADFLLERVRNVARAQDNSGVPVWQANLALLERLAREDFGKEASRATPSQDIRLQLVRGIEAIDVEIASGTYEGADLQKKLGAREALYTALVHADKALAEQLLRHGPTEADMLDSGNGEPDPSDGGTPGTNPGSQGR